MHSFFDEKTILITGGASGIGKVMAERLLSHNCTVIIWDKNTAAGNHMTVENKNKRGKLFFYEVDLSNPQSIHDCFTQTISVHEFVDIVINNAGIVTGTEFVSCTEEQFRKTMEVNTLAVISITHKFLKLMLEKDTGQIINIASAAGLVGVAKLADYAASKFAVVGFTESLRMELKMRNSHVSIGMVCPYYINTGMFDGVRTRFPFLLPILDPEYVVKRILTSIRKKKPCLKLPATIHLLNWARLFPIGVFDFIINLFGINKTMNEFRGRS